MDRVFKIELKRAFLNRLFLISILIGCTIAVLQIIFDVFPIMKYIPEIIEKNVYPHATFNKWMGGQLSSFWSSLFFTISPLLAAIPFADSFHTDRKTGYVKNIFTRSSKKQYYVSKFFAVFLSAGSAVVLPLLFNLYLTSLCLPSLTPAADAGTYALSAFDTGATMFYTHPFMYVFLYLLLVFVASGILTTIALALSFFIKYRYIVLLTPFLCCLFISFQAMFFSFPKLDVTSWINPAQPGDLTVVLPEMAIILILVILVYFIRGMQDETY